MLVTFFQIKYILKERGFNTESYQRTIPNQRPRYMTHCTYCITPLLDFKLMFFFPMWRMFSFYIRHPQESNSEVWSMKEGLFNQNKHHLKFYSGSLLNVIIVNGLTNLLWSCFIDPIIVDYYKKITIWLMVYVYLFF